MGQVSVEINGRKYQIACDDGQEAHLTRLGSYINNRVEELIAAVGQIGDARLLVMVSLLVADELSDAYSELDVARSADDGANARLTAEDKLSARIDGLSSRIESIAETLEQA
ncbi:MAG: cell division protein ZapA [Rhodospirillales bacterium]|nr:cell division protein ZapA [Rhodospirillales bacterium]